MFDIKIFYKKAKDTLFFLMMRKNCHYYKTAIKNKTKFIWSMRIKGL